jgi:hypothetical protein
MSTPEASSIRLKPYRLREASETIGIPYTSMRDAVQRGEVPHTKIGKIILIPATFVRQVLGGAQS